MARRGAPDVLLFASGGLRDGIDVAKCLALGAALCGLAGPFLRAAAQSEELLDERVRILQAQLRIAMLCAGAASLEDLHRAPLFDLNEPGFFAR
jgi:isopentenyl-diphosphate delta-isomerase